MLQPQTIHGIQKTDKMGKKVIRIMKLIISLSYCIIHQALMLIRRSLNKKIPGTFVVLYYHEIKPENKMKFYRQMAMLRRFALPVHADNVLFSTGKHHVAVTFDDAFYSVVENGFDAINDYNIPVSVFVPTAFIGSYPEWNFGGNFEICKEVVMSREQLTSLPRDLFRLGSHTCTHPDLTILDSVEIKKELCESRDELQKILGSAINLLAFPHGKFNKEIVEIAIDAGYRHVYTIMPQFPKQNPGSVIIGRTPANPYDWEIEFRLKLSGYYCWLSIPGSIKRFFAGLTQYVWSREC